MIKIFALILFVAALEGSYNFTSIAASVAIMIVSVLLAYLLCRNEKCDDVGLKINYKLFIYLIQLAKEIFFSAISVCKIILFRNKSELNPVTTKIITKQKTDESKVLFGNSITLTPGTITIDILKNTLILHAITAECAKEAKDLDIKIMKSQK